MADHPIDDAELLRATFAASARTIRRRQLLAEVVVGGGLVAAGGALWWLGATRGADLGLTALYVAAIAVTSRVRFDSGSGFTIPVQIAFVPMLFALDPARVPLLVALGLVIGLLPSALRGALPASRILLAPANAWFAVGPALILVLADLRSPADRPVLLVVALAAQFAGDGLAAAARERLRGGIGLRELLAEVRPVYAIDASLSTLGLLVAYATVDHPWAIVLVAPLLGVLSVFSRERRLRLEQLIELNDAYRGTALVLGEVIDADDEYTGRHTRGVVGLATALAVYLGLDVHRRRTVEFGALLHDVGKVAVPKEIINKPGRLDDHEWTIIRTHTIEGQRMLDRVGGLMQEVGHIVRSSHERWDGAGYPDGLAGEQIPLESRIIATCDAYNAMTTTRSYRVAMSAADAVAELERHAGTQFDPGIVDALLATLRLPPS